MSRILHFTYRYPVTPALESCETMGDYEEKVRSLQDMGFLDEQLVHVALRQANGDLTQAIDLMVTGRVSSVAVADNDVTSFSSPGRTIHCDVSQYTVENGRSACTCIALTAASRLLEICRKSGDNELQFSEQVIADTITYGVQQYSQIAAMTPVEHLSPQEVLDLSPNILLPDVKAVGAVKNGILTKDASAFTSFLENECRLDSKNDPSKYLAVVLVKPPETVLILLPPFDSQSNACRYVLFDSHPRPPSHPGSYMKLCSSMKELAKALETIFPYTDLGSDVPEMMAMMYNCYDAYAFQIA